MQLGWIIASRMKLCDGITNHENVAKQQHQPDIQIVGHQSLLQQYVQVQPALEATEPAVGDHQGRHALQVQCALGAWHTGLLPVGLEQHAAKTVGTQVREWSMGIHASSGKDASMARAFLGPPLRGRSPFVGPSFGWSCTFPGCLHACRLHEVTYQGGNAVLMDLFDGLSSEHIAGQAHAGPQHGALEQVHDQTE